MEIFFGILAVFTLFSSLSAQTSSVSYTSLTPDTVIRNPERGFSSSDHYFYASNLNVNLDPVSLQTAKANNMSIAYIIFYLDTFFNSSISDPVLNAISTSFTILRNNGFKAIVRFAYQHNESAVGYLDATKDRILGHISQLKPLLVQNADVILVVQTGFVGIWGEWHTSDNFGNNVDKNVIITPANYADRKAVSDAVLAALPPTRMIQQRYPYQKRTMYNQSGPIADSDAYSGSPVARIGHHNQCFLASGDDMGTYQKDPTLDYLYLAQETKYLPQGGETCGIDPGRTTCDTALLELARYHWTYLDRSPGISSTLQLFQNQGCLTTIGNRLGYRFQLISSVFPTSAKSNSQISVQINLNNTGFAAPFNPRVVYLVLKNSASQYSFKLSSNPNYWLPGNIVINENVSLTSVNPGTYKMYLNLPDPAPTLSSIVDYSIQFANVGTWDSTTGLNNLMQTINITN